MNRPGRCRDGLEPSVSVVGERVNIVAGLDHLEGVGQPSVVAEFQLVLAKIGLDHSALIGGYEM